MWRRMTQKMVKRLKMDGGINQLPRTRTSRVPDRYRELANKTFADLETFRTITALVEAVGRVAVVGKDDDTVAKLLKTNRSVYNKALSATDAEIGVEKYNWR